LRDDLLKKENDNNEALATVNLLMTNLKKQLEASKKDGSEIRKLNDKLKVDKKKLENENKKLEEILL